MTSAEAARPSVLIVDPSDESREVLRTLLERRGVDIFEARGGRQGLELAQRHHPRVIVLDAEILPPNDAATCEGFQAESRQSHSSLVLLAAARRDALSRVPSGSVVAKPYHYGPLIRTIESLLDGAVEGGRTRNTASA